MRRNKKYILDITDLQFKQVRIPWNKRILRGLVIFGLSLIISILYLSIFENSFGSPKEFKLKQDIEKVKLKYSMLNLRFKNAFATIDYLRLSDDERYRPILDMDSLPVSYRKPGYGGVDRYSDYEGLANSDLLISSHQKLDNLTNMAKVQDESFKSIKEKAVDQKTELDHMPWMSPVNVIFRLGDGFQFRQFHPVWGTPQMHWGQDFYVPYGTEVWATGDGTVIESGSTTGGFGNCVVIDHGYGLQTTYGHLSEIRVAKGLNVKRGTLIGLTGNSGTSTGPHLHYQIEKFGQHVNPLYYFNQDLTSEQYTEMIQAFASRTKFR